MDGVSFKQVDQYDLCCVENFSDELKLTLRENLTRICHGADQASKDRAIYKYPATIKHFWNERYSKKTWGTRIGMLGETPVSRHHSEALPQLRCGLPVLQYGSVVVN